MVSLIIIRRVKDLIRQPINIVLLPFWALSSSFFVFKNTYPHGEASMTMLAPQKIYLEFVNGGFFPGLLELFMCRPYKPFSFHLFYLPSLFLVNGDIRYSIFISGTLYYSLLLIYLYRIFKLYLSPLNSSIATAVIIFQPWAFSICLTPETSLISTCLLMIIFFYLLKSNYLKNRNETFSFYLLVGIANTVRPAVTFMYVYPIYWIILLKRKMEGVETWISMLTSLLISTIMPISLFIFLLSIESHVVNTNVLYGVLAGGMTIFLLAKWLNISLGIVATYLLPLLWSYRWYRDTWFYIYHHTVHNVSSTEGTYGGNQAIFFYLKNIYHSFFGVNTFWLLPIFISAIVLKKHAKNNDSFISCKQNRNQLFIFLFFIASPLYIAILTYNNAVHYLFTAVIIVYSLLIIISFNYAKTIPLVRSVLLIVTSLSLSWHLIIIFSIGNGKTFPVKYDLTKLTTYLRTSAFSNISEENHQSLFRYNTEQVMLIKNLSSILISQDILEKNALIYLHFNSNLCKELFSLILTEQVRQSYPVESSFFEKDLSPLEVINKYQTLYPSKNIVFIYGSSKNKNIRVDGEYDYSSELDMNKFNQSIAVEKIKSNHRLESLEISPSTTIEIGIFYNLHH